MKWVIKMLGGFTVDDLTEARAEGRREAYERANGENGRLYAFRDAIGFCEKRLEAEQTGSRRG